MFQWKKNAAEDRKNTKTGDKSKKEY